MFRSAGRGSILRRARAPIVNSIRVVVPDNFICSVICRPIVRDIRYAFVKRCNRALRPIMNRTLSDRNEWKRISRARWAICWYNATARRSLGYRVIPRVVDPVFTLARYRRRSRREQNEKAAINTAKADPANISADLAAIRSRNESRPLAGIYFDRESRWSAE